MIIVDTSVWITYFRRRESAVVSRLHELLDRDLVAMAAPVFVELLSGTGRAQQPLLRRVLGALPRYYPALRTWELIDLWLPRAAVANDHFGCTDLLIAALAAEHDCSLWSEDSDFRRMERLGFVTLAKA